MAKNWRVDKHLALILSAICIIAAPSFGQVGFALDEPAKKVRIPFTLKSNLIIVPLVLNNRLPLRFILDTGVRNAILTEKSYSDILKMPYSRKYTITGAGGEKLVDAYVTNNVTLSLPGIDGKGHAMLVLEQDYIKLRNFLGMEVHGMLGYEIFSRFVVEINYQQRLLTLTKPQHFRKKNSYSEFDIVIEDTKPFIYLPVTFTNGNIINAKLLIDTGASHGLMLDPMSGDSVSVPSNAIDSNIGRGLAGKIEGQVGRIKNIQFGKYDVENPIVSFPYPNSYMDSLTASGTFRNGTIGGEILSRYNLVLDYSKEKLYLKKNSSFRRLFHFNLSGITVRAIGARLREFEIDEVRVGSGAYEVGLRTGDKLKSINGIPIANLTLAEVNGLFNSKPGKRIRLVIERKGEVERYIFQLRSAI